MLDLQRQFRRLRSRPAQPGLYEMPTKQKFDNGNKCEVFEGLPSTPRCKGVSPVCHMAVMRTSDVSLVNFTIFLLKLCGDGQKFAEAKLAFDHGLVPKHDSSQGFVLLI